MAAKATKLKPDEKACLELRGLYEQYGYKKYKMGKFEEYSLYIENKDFLGSDKVITFTDLDGRLLALKPDVTLSIIKNTKASAECAERLYYIENVYRESRESHTFQEINQMGMEYIGNVDPYIISEVITLAAESLNKISDENILELSHMNFVVELLNSLQIAEHIKLKLLRLIRNKNGDAIRRNAEVAGLPPVQIETLCQIPFLYGNAQKTIDQARKIALNGTMNKALDELQTVCHAIAASGNGHNIQVDLSMVNDIDYYNGIIFKGYIKQLGKPILAGGQYDQAMAILGKKVEAIGFALYLNDINRISEDRPEVDVDAIILYNEKDDIDTVLRGVKELQQKGFTVRAERFLPQGLRFHDLYKIEDRQPVKETHIC